MIGQLARCLALIAATLLAPVAARAQGANVATEASRRFQRGVMLYNEGDFRGALLEFRRAHTLLPRASALYNIGQTEFQLREYAAALRTLERFLVETGKQAAHHAEVRETVELLRDRVGHIELRSDRERCEVAVDDQRVGTTPLAESLLVSIGRRRLAVSCPGGPRASREVDVAARETVRVALELGPPPADPPPRLAAPAPVRATAPPPARPAPRSGGHSALAWTMNGLLAAATAGAYTAAAMGSRQLQQLRSTYPVTPGRLRAKALFNQRLAVAGDVLAASTLLAVILTAYFSGGADEERAEARAVQVGPAAGGLAFGATF